MQFYTNFMQPTHAGNGDLLQPKPFRSTLSRNSLASNATRSTSCGSQQLDISCTNDTFEPTDIRTSNKSPLSRDVDENVIDANLGDEFFDWIKDVEELEDMDAIEVRFIFK